MNKKDKARIMMRRKKEKKFAGAVFKISVILAAFLLVVIIIVVEAAPSFIRPKIKHALAARDFESAEKLAGYPEDDEYREIRLVTTLRNDVFKDCISQDSPFGKALMGKRAGQTVTVHVNAQVSYPVKILEVIKGEDDPDLPISTY